MYKVQIKSLVFFYIVNMMAIEVGLHFIELIRLAQSYVQVCWNVLLVLVMIISTLVVN